MNERLQAIMGQAATAAVTGLSPTEATLNDGGSPPPTLNDAEREQHEDLLYLHVTLARRARQRMDSRPVWDGDYADDFRRREQALAAARHHQRALVLAGCDIPALLTDLLTTEEAAS